MMSCDIERKWSSNWISAGFFCYSWTTAPRPAPFFRREFDWNGGETVVNICGLGYYELSLNGRKVGDHVLDPVVTQYDKRARYVKYDLTGLLKKGRNAIGVILGDGWYNPATAEVWHFDKVSWRDFPKLLLEVETDGKLVLGTDESWKCLRENGPITFTQLRNGEHYDARKEVPGWATAGYDDSGWDNAAIVPGPGGVLTLQVMPPCRVTRTVQPTAVHRSKNGGRIYDMGQSVAGWSRIRVRGDQGAVVRIRHSELASERKDELDQGNINSFIKTGDTQTDRYTLKGGGEEEVWEPRFVYHGFQYVEVAVEAGEAEIISLEGRVVHTDFESIGSIESSDRALTRLFELTRRSFEGNYVGIPTDCPHREKNGWTGDASLASETGLFNYNLASSYAEWMQTIADAQRPNGQIPGIVPTGGWGFNWGSGPVWDSAFLVIPYNVRLHTGDSSIIERNYECMRRYLRYLETLASKHIVKFGLGDWCHHDGCRTVDTTLVSTAYYYYETVLVSKFATILGRGDESAELAKQAEEIRNACNERFYHGDGVYAKGEPTALGLSLELNLCPDGERQKTADRLATHMEDRRCRAEFGIVGAKYVPRALANNGHADTAYRILTQPAYPGWGNWLGRGATALWENWDGTGSRNHIMFGDIAAWMFRFPGGFRLRWDRPGTKCLAVQPVFLPEIGSFRAEYRGFVSAWSWKANGAVEFQLTVPARCTGELVLPEEGVRLCEAGEHTFTWKMKHGEGR